MVNVYRKLALESARQQQRKKANQKGNKCANLEMQATCKDMFRNIETRSEKATGTWPGTCSVSL